MMGKMRLAKSENKPKIWKPNPLRFMSLWQVSQFVFNFNAEMVYMLILNHHFITDINTEVNGVSNGA